MFCLLLSLLNFAFAAPKNNQPAKVKPFMSGMGASVGTMFVPLDYPSKFPTIKGQDTSPQFTQVQGDVLLGLKGTMFVNQQYRASLQPYLHHGFSDSQYNAYGVNLEVDKMAFREKNVRAYYGLGAGSANMSFANANGATLTGTQLYLKGQAGLLYFDRNKAYELGMYAQMGRTGRETLTTSTGNTFQNNGLFGSDDKLKGSMYFPTIGLQGTVYYGDFRKGMRDPQKQKKGNKKNGNQQQKKK